MQLTKEELLLLDEYVDKKLLRVAKHPEYDLFIYNYTKNAEFSGHWDEITTMCRGLVIDSEGTVHARPFEKFFNIEQTDPETVSDLVKNKIPFDVFEKVDGFLGIGFMYKGEFIISSRGSFISEPCKKANEIWNKNYAHLQPYENLTYIFEIIDSEQKIVVDYDFEDLVLLGINMTDSVGIEVEYENFKHVFVGDTRKFPRIVKRYDGVKDFTKIREMYPELNDGSEEGFVVRFKEPYNGFRMKLKYSEYFRLSKILTGLSTKLIWEFLKDNKDFSEMFENTPDEFFGWVTENKEKIENEYFKTADQAIKVFKEIYEEGMSKSDFVTEVNRYGIDPLWISLGYAQFDFKYIRFDEMIWQAVKPETELAHLNLMKNTED